MSHPVAAGPHQLQPVHNLVIPFLVGHPLPVQNALVIKASYKTQLIAVLFLQLIWIVCELKRIQPIDAQLNKIFDHRRYISAGMMLINHSQSMHRVNNPFQPGFNQLPPGIQ